MDSPQTNPPDEIVQAQQPIHPKYLTLSQAANIIGCSYETVRQWVKDGILPVMQITGSIMRIPTDAFFKFLEDNTCLGQQNLPGYSNTTTGQTTTSVTSDKSTVQALRIRRKRNAF